MGDLITDSVDVCVISDVRPLIVEDTKKVLTEMIQDGKKKTVSALRVTGIFQEAEAQNANSRIYPKNVLTEAVDAVQDLIKGRKMLGEFDHPPDAKIHLDRVSHLITKLWMEGNKVYGEAEILGNVPYGEQLKGLLESGVTIGVSSRGVGDMESYVNEGREMFKVMPGYHLITFDAVAEPSVSGTELTMLEHKIRERKEQANKHLIRKHKEHKLLEELKKGLMR